MSLLYNRVKCLTATTGTGNVTWGSIVTGFCSPAEAGIADGDVISYLIKDGNDFELGYGTYTAAGTVMSRDTVRLSKISGVAGTSKINLSGNASIEIAAAAEDIGRSWKQIASWDYSSDVANVDFANLAGWSEILAVIRGITASSSGNRNLQVSTDNGSTFFTASGDYLSVSTDGAEANTTQPAFQGTNNTTAVSGAMIFSSWNVSGYYKPVFIVNRNLMRFVAKTSPLNALRLANSAGNMTAGSCRIYGR